MYRFAASFSRICRELRKDRAQTRFARVSDLRRGFCRLPTRHVRKEGAALFVVGGKCFNARGGKFDLTGERNDFCPGWNFRIPRRERERERLAAIPRKSWFTVCSSRQKNSASATRYSGWPPGKEECDWFDSATSRFITSPAKDNGARETRRGGRGAREAGDRSLKLHFPHGIRYPLLFFPNGCRVFRRSAGRIVGHLSEPVTDALWRTIYGGNPLGNSGFLTRTSRVRIARYLARNRKKQKLANSSLPFASKCEYISCLTFITRKYVHPSLSLSCSLSQSRIWNITLLRACSLGSLGSHTRWLCTRAHLLSFIRQRRHITSPRRC